MVVSVRFKRVYSWNPDQIVALYRSAGWWEEYYDPAGIAPLITGSHIFIVGIDEQTGQAIAMGRILSDEMQTGYIHDLCVLGEFRGQGVGTQLLTSLIGEGRKAGIRSLFLVAEPDTSSFYEKSGFISQKGLIFFIMNMEGEYEDQ